MVKIVSKQTRPGRRLCQSLVTESAGGSRWWCGTVFFSSYFLLRHLRFQFFNHSWHEVFATYVTTTSLAIPVITNKSMCSLKGWGNFCLANGQVPTAAQAGGLHHPKQSPFHSDGAAFCAEEVLWSPGNRQRNLLGLGPRGAKLHLQDLGRRFHFQQILCSTPDHPDLQASVGNGRTRLQIIWWLPGWPPRLLFLIFLIFLIVLIVLFVLFVLFLSSCFSSFRALLH